MSSDQNMQIPSELAEIIADFEAKRLDAGELGEALMDFCGQAEIALGIREQIEQLAGRVEMMHFSLCRAERRGAVLELLADFRALSS